METVHSNTPEPPKVPVTTLWKQLCPHCPHWVSARSRRELDKSFAAHLVYHARQKGLAA